MRIITDALLSDPPDFDTISNVLRKGQFDGVALQKIASNAIWPCIDHNLEYYENGQEVSFVDRSARLPAFLSLMLENGMSPNEFFEKWNVMYALCNAESDALCASLRLLLDAGADPNLNGSNCDSPTVWYESMCTDPKNMCKLPAFLLLAARGGTRSDGSTGICMEPGIPLSALEFAEKLDFWYDPPMREGYDTGTLHIFDPESAEVLAVYTLLHKRTPYGAE